jgi:hypothetical protein
MRYYGAVKRQSPSLVAAGVLAASVLTGCAVETSLDSPDSAACIRAIRIVAHDNDRKAIPKLIGLLDRDDTAVRILAIRTLEKMTGQTLGYDATAPSFERAEAVDRWRAWYLAESKATTGRSPSLQTSASADPPAEGGPR